MLKLSVVYDNNQKREDLTPSWGFSSFIKTHDKSVLFDTGADSQILMDNMEKMGLDPHDINAIIISHTHRDHTGGLRELLRINSSASVYVPNTGFKRKLENKKNDVFQIRNYQEIYPGISVISHNNTQALVLDGENGMFMAVSRIPTKALEIMKKARKLMDKDINFLLGGFCLHNSSETAKIIKPMERLGVRKIMICHCCGELDEKILMEKFAGDCIRAGVGSRSMIQV
ncbi:MBL fold metallo-hydrolase [Methanobacterium petrolearium]|uniref:MBL fold metallo-hydrolase n=1 Tax=Methanobacterium petrolearium TaxID=710190 RepID=UPI001AEAEF69|nr:MBL fold metallo-hydrolase [Methanobacterium petrolearium]MBP1945768.1 7,8-dihydropterin-6-yl-methyl-4-(beta-D-ribofuranosyl)aminobenzene 5'-phosphate synthase [Methanobacterium petrolearium]BDZ72016.1 metal-dependent hydrolase [Methanobacterium petrolearium]